METQNFLPALLERRLEVVGTKKRAREGDTRLPHPSRVSLARACSLFRPLQSAPDNSNLQGKSQKGSSYREFEENSRVR